MQWQELLQNVVLMITMAILLFFVVWGSSFLTSLIYFTIIHPKGSLDLIAKTLLLSLVCVALMLAGAAIFVISIPFKLIIWLKTKFGKSQKAVTGGGSVDNGAFVVHLVHGTFEPGASWTNGDSLLWSGIKEAVPNAVRRIFVWSGDNSDRARSAAASTFANEICRLQTDRQIIVAHSHSGNIVKTMLAQHPDLRKKIKGIVLLSTPFIHRTKVDRSGKGFAYMHTVGFALVVPLLLGMALFLMLQFLEHCVLPMLHLTIPKYQLLVPLPFALGMIFAFFVAVEILAGRRVRADLDDALKAAGAEDESLAKAGDVKIFVSIGDEADAALRISGTLHEVCMATFGELRKAAELLGESRWIMGAITVITYACLLIYLYARLQIGVSITIICVTACIINILLCIQQKGGGEEYPPVLVLAGVPMSMVACMVNTIKSFAFGDMRYVFYPQIFSHSSETPSGEWYLNKTLPVSDGMLNHSSHSSGVVIPKVVQCVQKWAIATSVVEQQ